jgi:hypothetical protein
MQCLSVSNHATLKYVSNVPHSNTVNSMMEYGPAHARVMDAPRFAPMWIQL